MSRQSSFEFAPSDPYADVRAAATKQAFALGVQLLVASGMAEPVARSFMGKRMKEIGKPALLRAVMQILLGPGVNDPRAYLAGVKGPAQQQEQAADDEGGSGLQPWMT